MNKATKWLLAGGQALLSAKMSMYGSEVIAIPVHSTELTISLIDNKSTVKISLCKADQ